jgi:hypothetical protein
LKSRDALPFNPDKGFVKMQFGKLFAATICGALTLAAICGAPANAAPLLPGTTVGITVFSSSNGSVPLSDVNSFLPTTTITIPTSGPKSGNGVFDTSGDDDFFLGFSPPAAGTGLVQLTTDNFSDVSPSFLVTISGLPTDLNITPNSVNDPSFTFSGGVFQFTELANTLDIWSFVDAPVAVPEPASLAIFSVGLFGLAMVRRRRG